MTSHSGKIAPPGLDSLTRKARSGDVEAKFEIIRRAVVESDNDAWDAFIELHQNLIRRWAIRFLQTYNMRTSTTLVEDICQSAILSFFERLCGEGRSFALQSVAQTMEYLKATVWSAVTALRRKRVSLRQIARLSPAESEALRRIISAPATSERLNPEERNMLLAELGDKVELPSDPDRHLAIRLAAQEALVGVLNYHSQQDTDAKHLLAKLTTQRELAGLEEVEDKPSPLGTPEEEHLLDAGRCRLWQRCLAVILGGERWLPDADLSPEELRPLADDPRLTVMQREEMLMLYRHYLDGYSMQEIYERWLEEFGNIRQVYRIKERLLRRFSRHLGAFAEFAGEF